MKPMSKSERGRTDRLCAPSFGGRLLMVCDRWDRLILLPKLPPSAILLAFGRARIFLSQQPETEPVNNALLCRHAFQRPNTYMNSARKISEVHRFLLQR